VSKITIGHIPIDVLSFDGALDAICDRVGWKVGGTVFTPNVDHIVLAETDLRFREAYRRAALSLVDGQPVRWTARLLGAPLPSKISGSDLARPLLVRAAQSGFRVFFLGGAPGVAEAARSKLEAEVPELLVCGTDAPKVDMSAPKETRAEIVARLRDARPDLVLVCMGAPKQELLATELAHAFPEAVFVCVGAAIDFLAGTARRAPSWMSRAGLEWAYRLAKEPRRLWRRYLVQDPKYVAVVARTLARRVRRPSPR
jgi:N-acetylglucosaminyldiphosphoundecaprenol N-acetyl-beta-D-mannosaminyltransferase